MNNDFLAQFGEPEALSVTELTRAIKRLLEGSVPPGWVKGEVTNFRRQASGHLYFSLKDEGAQLPVVMFRGNAAGLEFELENGSEVMVYGELSVYEPHGRYQLIARAAIEAGQGKLHREFERLKRKLLEEGIFDRGKKKALPLAPRSVAFITSPSGAAVQDFIRIVKRRGWVGCLTVIPAKVQGEGAVDSILEGLALAEAMNRFDLIVIGRGGGSMEDLWCFNDERLVRAVASLSIPIVSAVGHEIDFTLSDFAADVRAETPSAAAELISSAYMECLDRVEVARESLEDAVEERLLDCRRSVREWKARLAAVAPERHLETASLRMDEIASRIETIMTRELALARGCLSDSRTEFGKLHPERVVAAYRQKLSVFQGRLHHESARQHLMLRHRWRELFTQLESLSPTSTLNRGYVILSDVKGDLVSSVAALEENARVRATLSDGESWLRVDEKQDR